MRLIILYTIFLIIAIGIIIFCIILNNKKDKQINGYTTDLEYYQLHYPTIEQLDQETEKLKNDYIQKVIELENNYATQKQQLLTQTDADIIQAQNTIKNCINVASNNYCSAIEETYNDIERKFDSYKKHCDERKQTLEDEITEAEEKLTELKETISAGAQEQLREKQNKEKINFYKLVISDEDISDIHILNDVRSMMHTPAAIGKIIWSTYFQKKTTELCNRVVAPSPKKICGIYKITDQVTQQCYLGQSVDISARLKEHIKCGLGIDAPSANKLYQAMQEDGIWNFTFEVIEECDRSKLNEREAFWINLLGSNLYGLNTTAGNKEKSI